MVLAAGLVAGLLAASPMAAMAGGRGDASEIIVDYSASGRQQYDATSRELEARLAATPPILSQQTIYFTQIAIKRYEDIAAAGGWPQVQTKDVLRLGNNSATVAQLRRRLVASGDLDPGYSLSHFFDSPLQTAVRNFQLRHGLFTDGAVGRETLAALNVPVEERLKQLRTNLVRLSAMGGDLGQRYVMVNIPGAEIEAVENGAVVTRHTAIVGKIDRPSPLVTSRISQINFNPFWHAPKSIVQKDIIPRMREDPTYLSKYRIRIYDQSGNEIDPSMVNWQSEEAVDYLLRQDPGELNSMGSIRINFANKHSVYLHDTPQQSLFGSNYRFHSSGCVRVHDVRKLVSWLLEPNGNWTPQIVDATIASGERIDVSLSVPTPIYMTYITAWGTPDGIVHFRPDVYNRDAAGDLALSGQDS
ncbi:MAG: L,D-transpeptidase family protein [Rhodobiaceae bacterium]|nr:L,D-transpeptidase family protein [Rhodobiaceae bacterium]MCC0041616.1 L,D-transpeptidase family protein [Rhodobiaceae bacterium]